MENRFGIVRELKVPLVDYSKEELRMYAHQEAAYAKLLADLWPCSVLVFKKRPRNKGKRKYRAKKGWRRYS